MLNLLDKDVNQFIGVPYKHIIQTYYDVDSKVLQYLLQQETPSSKITNLYELFLHCPSPQLQLQYVKEYKNMGKRIPTGNIRIDSFCTLLEICLENWNLPLWKSCWNTFFQLLQEDWHVILSIWFQLQVILFSKHNLTPLLIYKESTQLFVFAMCRDWLIWKSFFEQVVPYQKKQRQTILELIEPIVNWLQNPDLKNAEHIPKHIQLYYICETEKNLKTIESWIQKELFSGHLPIQLLKQMVHELVKDLPLENGHKSHLLQNMH